LAEFCLAAGGRLLAVGLDYCKLRVYSLVVQLSRGAALRPTIGAAMTIRRPSIMILSTLALLVLLGMLFASEVSATSGTMSVTTDTILTEDHDGDITVDTDNVTLDCDGHVVTGPGSGIGIRVGVNRTGITVKNCEVTNFTDGIHVTESTNITLVNNTSHHNSSIGIMLNQSNGNTVTGNQIDDNGFGRHATWGIFLNDADNNVLTNNSANRNGETNYGFAAGPNGSDGNTLINNTASGGQRGFDFSGSSGNTFEGNTATGVSVHGFESDAFADNNVFKNNTITDSGGTGFRLSGTNNTLTGNQSHRNGGWGFEDFSVPGANSYSKNVCTGNAFSGSTPSGLCQEEWVALVDTSQGMWHLRHSENDVTSFFYGNPGDIPFLGDWDCDGIATPGLFRQSDAFAYLRNSNSQGIADIRFFFGNPSDIPLAGDFNGDGCDTLSIYRPSEARFYIVNALGTNDGGLGPADYSFLFGNLGDKPVVGDWDGDGIDEIGLHRESTGLFYWRNTLDTGNADGTIFFGDPGDRFVAGDWGIVDGKDTPGLFRPSNTTFYFRHTLTAGNADSQLEFGQTGWMPVAGDFGFG
jgi:parallel beta-helix repeat protein